MGSHTPGPWEIVQGDEWTTDIGTPEGEYEDGRKRHWNIASVNKRRDEWKANRLLIAAAPDLLDSCEALVAAMQRYQVEVEGDAPQHHVEMMDGARAAIAKAKGIQHNNTDLESVHEYGEGR